MKSAVMTIAALALALTSCRSAELTSFEAKNLPACSSDQGSWAGQPQTTRYVEAGFHDLDHHLGRFIDDLEQGARAAADRPRDDWPQMFDGLHGEVEGNIVRVGRLLPRLGRAMDIPPLTAQMQEKRIGWPRGDHHTEYLRVAIAEEVVDHQNSSEQTARFLARLGETEALLLDLKSGGADPASLGRLNETALALREDWRAAAFGFRRVIFDRPNMPIGESLGERLQARVSTICGSYSTCGGEEDSCVGAEADVDGSMDAPAEPA